MAAMYFALWFYAAHDGRLLSASVDPRMVAGISRAFKPGMPIYATATLSALISAWPAVGLFAAIAVFYVLESSLFARSA